MALPVPETHQLPEWLRPLQAACADVRAEDVSRLLPPEDGSGRGSAVLIAFTETPDGPAVLFIERAATLRTHAGQVAFPGGATDATDIDAAHTALREAHEEVGLDPSSVVVFAELPGLFLRPSRFVVTPVLGWWARPHAVGVREPAEVAAVAVLPIAHLADPANRFRVRHPSGILGPGFEANGWFIWGFTAMLLDWLLELAGWARDWDGDRVRDLP